MKKRTIALLLAVTLLGGLTACGGESASASQSGGDASASTSAEGEDSSADASVGDASQADVSSAVGSQGDASAPEDAGSASVQEAGGDAANSASTSGSSGEICAYPPAQETDVSQKEEPAVTAPDPKPVQQTEPEPQPDPDPQPVTPTADAARTYIGQSASSLIAALGSPISSSYAPSCLGPGEDGELIYSGFTVYTYRENGVETVEDVL